MALLLHDDLHELTRGLHLLVEGILLERHILLGVAYNQVVASIEDSREVEHIHVGEQNHEEEQILVVAIEDILVQSMVHILEVAFTIRDSLVEVVKILVVAFTIRDSLVEVVKILEVAFAIMDNLGVDVLAYFIYY